MELFSDCFKDVDVLHDCMWSGSCDEDKNSKQCNINSFSNYHHWGKWSDCSLFSSPSFTNCSFFDIFSIGEEENSVGDDYEDEDLPLSPQSGDSGDERIVRRNSLINDHSYDSTHMIKLCDIEVASSNVDSCSSTASSNLGNLVSKSMYKERRKEHNNSEKKRRDHLRNAFDCLREQIPKLKDKEKKAARVIILKEATSYVSQLKDKQRYLERTKSAELVKKENLLKRLKFLQSNRN